MKCTSTTKPSLFLPRPPFHHFFFFFPVSFLLSMSIHSGCDMARHSTAERSHPTSEVRVRSQEDPMPEGRQPRGATPRPRSGGAAQKRYPASEVRGGCWEELPHALTPKARGSGREEQPTSEARGSDKRRYPEPWLRGRRRA